MKYPASISKPANSHDQYQGRCDFTATRLAVDPKWRFKRRVIGFIE
jgi:hypothetical protein